MALSGPGPWGGEMRNAQTYWGLTRKIGPYRPTKYDDELAHSRQPAFGHYREVEFRPAPYIPTKPFPGMFNYDTHDVVSKATMSVPSNARASPFLNRSPNIQDVTGRKRMKFRDTNKGPKNEDPGMTYDNLGNHGEPGPHFYDKRPPSPDPASSKKRGTFHYNDIPGESYEERRHDPDYIKAELRQARDTIAKQRGIRPLGELHKKYERMLQRQKKEGEFKKNVQAMNEAVQEALLPRALRRKLPPPPPTIQPMVYLNQKPQKPFPVKALPIPKEAVALERKGRKAAKKLAKTARQVARAERLARDVMMR